MSFKSLRIMPCQFFGVLLGILFVLLRFKFKAWFGILQSSILTMCPSYLGLLSLIISSIFVIPILFLT